MMINTKYRSDEVEIMDDFDIGGEVLKKNLDEIAKINQLLGGNAITLKGVAYLLDKIETGSKVTIADIGCGHGDMLRQLAEYKQLNHIKLKLLGIDANKNAIDYAEHLSESYANIAFKTIDIFSEDFSELSYDIALCTLTLHHFENKQLLKLLQMMIKKARIGIVINDLHRNITAYRLFQLISSVFRLSKMSSQDGLTSILRGFKKEELEDFSKKLNIKKYKIRWKWAFRYQWIIETI